MNEKVLASLLTGNYMESFASLYASGIYPYIRKHMCSSNNIELHFANLKSDSVRADKVPAYLTTTAFLKSEGFVQEPQVDILRDRYTFRLENKTEGSHTSSDSIHVTFTYESHYNAYSVNVQIPAEIMVDSDNYKHIMYLRDRLIAAYTELQNEYTDLLFPNDKHMFEITTKSSCLSGLYTSLASDKMIQIFKDLINDLTENRETYFHVTMHPEIRSYENLEFKKSSFF